MCCGWMTFAEAMNCCSLWTKLDKIFDNKKTYTYVQPNLVLRNKSLFTIHWLGPSYYWIGAEFCNPISSQWLKECILALITAIMTATHDEQKKEVYIICRLQIVTKLFGQGYIMVISLYYHISMSDWFDAPNYVAWQFDKG